MPAGPLALLQVGRVAAAVQVDLLLGEVEFKDLGDRAHQELAVVADDDRAGAQPGDVPFQPFQTVQVEVVGGLVEQEDVVAGEQERGKSRAGGLAAGECGHRQVESDGETQVRGDLLGPLVQVGATESEPALQRLGVRVVGTGRPVDEGLRGGVHRGLGIGDARAAGQELAHGLVGAALRFLRQVADRGGGRGEPQLALLRLVETGEQPEQRRFTGAVDSDETDHITGRDHEVELGEESAVAVSGGEVLGDESGSHQGADPNRPPDRPGQSGRSGRSGGPGVRRRCPGPEPVVSKSWRISVSVRP